MIREEIHRLVDQLPEQVLEQAKEFLRNLRTQREDGLTPLERALRDAPLDDEPTTPEEEEAIAEAWEEYRQGKSISHEELLKRLGLENKL